jgi:hypothetical protein
LCPRARSRAHRETARSRRHRGGDESDCHACHLRGCAVLGGHDHARSIPALPQTSRRSLWRS